MQIKIREGCDASRLFVRTGLVKGDAHKLTAESVFYLNTRRQDNYKI